MTILRGAGLLFVVSRTLETETVTEPSASVNQQTAVAVTKWKTFQSLAWSCGAGALPINIPFVRMTA